MCVMRVNAINEQSFGNGARTSKEVGSHRRANVDAALALSDNDLKKIAYYQACLQTNEDKHRKINNLSIAALPVVAAVRDTVLTRGNGLDLFGGKLMPGTATRLLTGTKTFAKWTGALALASAVIAGFNKLEDKSEKFRKFTKEQPYTAMAVAWGSAIALYYGVGKGISKLAQKLIKPDAKFWNKLCTNVVKFNQNKVVKNLTNAYINASDKIHPALKGMGAVGLALAPTAMVLGGILYSLNHSAKRNRQAENNYVALKTTQAVLANARARELA